MYFSIFKFNNWVVVHFPQLTKMHESRFAFGDPETVCTCPLTHFLDALLQLTLSILHIFGSGSDTEVVNIKIIINSKSDTLWGDVNLYIE